MKNFLVVLLIIAVAVGLTACSSETPDGEPKQEYSIENINQDLVQANTGFAFDILKKLNAEDEENNVFISPLSISTALSMTYNGSQATTREAMAKVLGYESLELEALNESYQNLIAYLNNIDSKVELNIGNSIWIREGEEIREDFLLTNRKHFDAEAEMLDFSKDGAAERINGWISEATKGKVPKMIDPPISPQVVMYLINAIYFKGQWAEQFDPKQTTEEKFTAGTGEQQDVSMMNRKGSVEYADGSNYKAVRLPYGSGKTSMYCILPNEGTGINNFINNLDREQWKQIRDTVAETDDVILKLPRFKIEYGIKSLNDSLIALGMGEAFNAGADFSGIREGLFISRVLHKAVIEVNEEGSEAAGVTVVEMQESAALEPITFIANRPFVFVIADDETGTILFMGKLYDI